MRILNFGSCNIDFVYSVDNMVNPGETISAKCVEKFPGGKGLNQSIACARAGIPVFHAGNIGGDGVFLREVMESSGVDTRYLKITDTLTGHAIIQVTPNGENSIIVYGGANEEITKEYVDEVMINFSENDFLILQNEISEIPYIVEKAFEIGMKIVLNPSPFNDRIKIIDFDRISYLILNEHEAESLSGKTEKEGFIKWCRKNHPDIKVILTLGKQGSIYFDKDVEIAQDAYKVNAVDTTAAGDTFTGFFFASICKGETPQNALKIASMASAISVTKKGAASSIPTIDDVLDKINSRNTASF